jgi:hypothetical protein
MIISKLIAVPFSLGIYHMPNTALNILHILAHLIPLTTL